MGEARLARLHAYWLGKGRDLPAGERGEVPPLIPRLRSELEPRLLAGMSSALPPEAAADVPFQGHDPKRQQRMVDSEESYTDMLEQRDDLEVVRILSDQVRYPPPPSQSPLVLHPFPSRPSSCLSCSPVAGGGGGGRGSALTAPLPC